MSEMTRSFYFIGIAGTGMATVAGYLKELGYEVSGSDAGVYPPMSDMLREQKITVFEGYDAEHLVRVKPDVVVVGNRIARNNPEAGYVLANKIPHTSFPQLVGGELMRGKKSIVVAGTHGKTTTTALLAHVLGVLGEDPSYIVGGIPCEGGRSFRVGGGEYFCIEGDEYDSAFFAKEAKFLYYRPNFLLLNTIELDHVDIYRDVEEIVDQFARLVSLVEDPDRIVANIDCPRVAKLIARHKIDCVKVSPYERNARADVVVETSPPETERVEIRVREFGKIELETGLIGDYNAANIAMVVGALRALGCDDMAMIAKGVASFRGVKKRMERAFSVGGVDCYEDFAHHPTAVRKVLGSLRRMYPARRLIAVFDLQSASSRRNVFFTEYRQNLQLADVVALRCGKLDTRISPEERMNVQELAKGIGTKARAFVADDELTEFLAKELESGKESSGAERAGDVVVFMSCVSFRGVIEALERAI